MSNLKKEDGTTDEEYHRLAEAAFQDYLSHLYNSYMGSRFVNDIQEGPFVEEESS